MQDHEPHKSQTLFHIYYVTPIKKCKTFCFLEFFPHVSLDYQKLQLTVILQLLCVFKSTVDLCFLFIVLLCPSPIKLRSSKTRFHV